MASRPRTRAQIIDSVEQFLQDTANARYTVADIGEKLDDAVVEVSESVPYVMVDTYQLETRTGTATSTSANNLVDATEAQFALADVGKRVFNRDDKTWAVITSYSSTSQVGLSKDIMASGEAYEIYNEGCWSKKQINIKNSDDRIHSIGRDGIIAVEYPVDRSLYFTPDQRRNFTLLEQGKILELDVNWVDDTKDTDADKDVYVYVARTHKLNNLTDLAGEVDLGAGYAAGTTTVHMDGLAATEVIYKDTLLYFAQLGGNTANSRVLYKVTEDVTLAANEGDVKIWPGLESALVDNDDVTFIRSTLTPELERILIQIVSGECLMSMSIKNIDNIVTGDAVSQKQYSTGERIAEKARARLHKMVDVNLRMTAEYSRA